MIQIIDIAVKPLIQPFPDSHFSFAQGNIILRHLDDAGDGNNFLNNDGHAVLVVFSRWRAVFPQHDKTSRETNSHVKLN